MRARGRMTRRRFPSLDAALDEAELQAAQATLAPRAQTVDLRVRQFAPETQVAVRIEVSGPGRLLPAVRGGLDVRGDGSTEAWTGRVRREVVKPARRETPGQALRRVLGAQSASVEP
ncbi:MAG: hypothetical protein QOK31_28 [Solirubrobacteraceae bacterium]|nr:hypothetical protein [Solirubrobacteraceae bacterium]